MKTSVFKLEKIAALLSITADCLIVLVVLVVLDRFFDICINISFFNGSVHFLVVFLAVFVLSAFYLDMYKFSFKRQRDVAVCVFISCVIASAITILLMFTGSSSQAFSTEYYKVYIDLSIMSLSLFVWRLFLNVLIRKTRVRESILIIEDRGADISFAKKIKYSNLEWYDAWYETIDTPSETSVDNFLRRELPGHNSVFITQSIPDRVKKKIIDSCILTGMDVYIVPTFHEINITKYVVTQFDETPVFLIMPFKLHTYQRVMKRIFDIVFSALGILVLSPAMLAAAIAVKLDSHGPALYCQERITKNKRKFNIYKFRTMVADAEKASGPTLASENDSRITRTGRFLRKTKLDELPQLFNILRGDMSIIGPRPERPVFVEKFCREFPDYGKRFVVKAGLTGYAQTYGGYNTNVRDKLLYDLLYIRHYSFLLDLKIIILTIKSILKL